ncbi:MAG: hypothetical protein VYC09_01530 [Verrucomicrobiota bacterium]|jgi:hypothetical protein|nr:hypothetical protein [Verrucomicrobiota bacterium]
MFIQKNNLFVPIFRAVLLILIPIALISCSIFNPKPKPGLVEPKAAVPADFLFSWHAPYNKWMNEPVRVYYNEVPLEEIFKNAPLLGLSYNFIKKPNKTPLVSIDSIGITRRQLLWAIAHDNNLSMSLKSLPNGHPSEIIIRDRGDATETQGKDKA